MKRTLKAENELAKQFFSRENTVLFHMANGAAGGDHAPHVKFKTQVSTRDDNGYDTDLEKEREKTILEGNGAQKRYMKACRKLKVQPIDVVFCSLSQLSFHLGNRFPNEQEVLAMAIGIAGSHTLQEVRFVHNKLSSTSVLYLCAAVWENTNITYLDLRGNHLDTKSLDIIVEMANSSPHLTTLFLSDNNLKDTHGPQLERLLLQAQAVRYLDLSYNQLGDRCADHIGRGLKDNIYLLDLDLSWNCIRTKGAEFLCEGLKSNNALRVLNLRMNGVSTEGAGHFSHLLARNRVLVEVDLSQNRIYDKGYGYFAKMVVKNENLSRLSVGHNPVSTSGVRVFLEALLKSKTTQIKNLDLSGIYISKEMEDLVQSLKAINPSLQIDVHGVVNKDTQTNETPQNTGVGVHANMHPLEIMRFYIEKTGSRIIDVFRLFDRENRNILTRADFIKGTQKLNIPLTAQQVDDLMSILDPNNSGTINFGSMSEGDKEARSRLRKRRERMRKQSLVKRPDFNDI